MRTACRCPRVRGVKTHPPTCPEVRWLAEVAQALAPELAVMARQRARAEAEAADIVLC